MSAITFEALAGKLGIDVSEWKRGLSNAGQAMKAFENGVRAMSAQAGQAVKQLANSFSIAAAAATAAAAASVKASADFEQSMARVKALLSGGIDDASELEKAYQSLAAQAKQLGADTVFTSQRVKPYGW